MSPVVSTEPQGTSPPHGALFTAPLFARAPARGSGRRTATIYPDARWFRILYNSASDAAERINIARPSELAQLD